jgi:hypothetical protein
MGLGAERRAPRLRDLGAPAYGNGIPVAAPRHPWPSGRAYVCEPVPDDGRDDEPWLVFEMTDPTGPFEPGAILEMRPPESRFFGPLQG